IYFPVLLLLPGVATSRPLALVRTLLASRPVGVPEIGTRRPSGSSRVRKSTPSLPGVPWVARVAPSTTPWTRVPRGSDGSSTVARNGCPARLRSDPIVSLSRTRRTVSTGKLTRRLAGRAMPAEEPTANIKAIGAQRYRCFINRPPPGTQRRPVFQTVRSDLIVSVSGINQTSVATPDLAEWEQEPGRSRRNMLGNPPAERGACQS